MQTIFLIFFSLILFCGCSDRPAELPLSSSTDTVKIDKEAISSSAENISGNPIPYPSPSRGSEQKEPLPGKNEPTEEKSLAGNPLAEDPLTEKPAKNSAREPASDSAREPANDPVDLLSDLAGQGSVTDRAEKSDPIADFQNGQDPVSWNPDDPSDPIRQYVLDKAKKNREHRKYHPILNEDAVRNSGIRYLAGKRIRLFTDLPSSPELDRFPADLDQALVRIADRYGIPQADLDSFSIDAFLIGKRDLFEKLGVLRNIPPFENGYSSMNRIFALDQKFLYYNRFLLIHELVHSFMFEIFGQLEPYWFSEGSAEQTALYRLIDQKLELGIIPADSEETPGFERLRTIQKDTQKGAAKSPEEIFAFGPKDYIGTRAYAWSWAFVLFMNNHPDYKTDFRKVPYYMMLDHPNDRFKALYKNRWNELLFDWNDFVRSFDYQYDFGKMPIDHTSGKELDGQKDLDLSANRGWQNSGIKLEAGKSYRIRAAGRFTIADPHGDLPCTPGGITLRYYQGYPIGQLLGILLTSDAGSDRIFPIGNGTRITPERSGTLYLKINDSGGRVEKNKGTFKVRIEETDGK
ncbi:MAG: hypothetical protein Q4G69_00610 [Planctomycetia bacterium]|nr:hypothetical protein [Planctomycetia bacterium]